MIRIEAVRRMIGAMVEDVLDRRPRRGSRPTTSARPRTCAPRVAPWWPFARDAGRPRGAEVVPARRILAEMFVLFMAEPATLPPEWSGKAGVSDEAKRARAVCDYIAGMTDRYAIEEHRKLFSLDLALDL
ncbi:hypothetical protein GMDG_08788 [Pseudogymnoascus destructans 20631-21]|uniref:Phosphohydrolase-associated domain-containing protein n=1 Tax=Pseudogymnoascus destructans (strain ATCC MYA-4855 / 20631-21) TaxID=658429 RepID=L8FNI3_PSED2|nr:hypothetical protein GMDG_08788 [Pseudogymnoascus destructans 20631-21]